MDTCRQVTQTVSSPLIEKKHSALRGSIARCIFTTNWGFVLIGALVALGIGVSALHTARVEAAAQQAPNAEIETVYDISPS